MSELRLDENLAIREVLDELVEMVSKRERLIHSASQQAEKMRDQRMAQHVKSLEAMMSDFVALFGPVLDKVRGYGESLRGSISESQAYLKSIAGIIEAGKTVQGSSATLQELEKDANGVEEDLGQSMETLDKIEDLLKRAEQYGRVSQSAEPGKPAVQQSSYRLRRVPPRNDDAHASRSRVFSGSGFSSYESSQS